MGIRRIIHSLSHRRDWFRCSLNWRQDFLNFRIILRLYYLRCLIYTLLPSLILLLQPFSHIKGIISCISRLCRLIRLHFFNFIPSPIIWWGLTLDCSNTWLNIWLRIVRIIFINNLVLRVQFVLHAHVPLSSLSSIISLCIRLVYMIMFSTREVIWVVLLNSLRI